MDGKSKRKGAGGNLKALIDAEKVEVRAMQMKKAVSTFKSAAKSTSTKKTYMVHLETYLKFCDSVRVNPVPLPDDILDCYIAYLAKVKCFKYVQHQCVLLKYCVTCA